MPKKTEPLPEWVHKLVSFIPRFPGDGFNHTKPQGGIPFVECPCGWDAIYIDQQKPGAQVAICPQCNHWHSVLVEPPATPLGGSFIICGQNKT